MRGEALSYTLHESSWSVPAPTNDKRVSRAQKSLIVRRNAFGPSHIRPCHCSSEYLDCPYLRIARTALVAYAISEEVAHRINVCAIIFLHRQAIRRKLPHMQLKDIKSPCAMKTIAHHHAKQATVDTRAGLKLHEHLTASSIEAQRASIRAYAIAAPP